MICNKYHLVHLIELVLVKCPEEELHLDSLLKPSSLLVRLWVNYLRKLIWQCVNLFLLKIQRLK